jgi:hypothetical protein
MPELLYVAYILKHFTVEFLYFDCQKLLTFTTNGNYLYTECIVNIFCIY